MNIMNKLLVYSTDPLFFWMSVVVVIELRFSWKRGAKFLSYLCYKSTDQGGLFTVIKYAELKLKE